MTTFWTKVRRAIAAAYAWEKVDAHRRSLYKQARVVLPMLGAAGIITPGVAGYVLDALAVLSGASLAHLASRNV